MYCFNEYDHIGLGLAPNVAIVGTAVANVAVTAYHAAKVSALQQGFQAKLESDEEKKNYIKYLVVRIQSVAQRLGQNGVYRPGTEAFEGAIKIAMARDMNYKGNCNADIYYPLTKDDVPGKPRKIWATIDRTGYVKPGSPVPPDVGPIWATGCKNADDQARMAYIDRLKGERKHSHFKIFKEDIGSLNLLLRAGTGIFMVIIMIIIIKVQRAVVAEQAPPKRKRKKKKEDN